MSGWGIDNQRNSAQQNLQFTHLYQKELPAFLNALGIGFSKVTFCLEFRDFSIRRLYGGFHIAFPVFILNKANLSVLPVEKIDFRIRKNLRNQIVTRND